MSLNLFRKNLIPNIIVGIYLAIAIFSMVVSPIQVDIWNQTPFLGGFVNPAMQFIKVRKVTPGGDWPVNKLGFDLDTKLLAVNGRETPSSEALKAVLDDASVGDVVTLTALQDGQIIERTVQLSQFSFNDKLVYYYIPLLLGFLILLIALRAFSDQVNRPLSGAITIFTASISLFLTSYFDFLTTHTYPGFFILSIGVMAASLIQIAFLLSRRRSAKACLYWISAIGFPHNLLLSTLGIYFISLDPTPPIIMTILLLLIASLGISVITLLIQIFILRARSNSPLIERQMDILTGVTIVSYFPLLIQTFVNLLNRRELYINPVLFLSMGVMPVAYAIISHKFSLPENRNWILRSLIYVGFTVVFALVYTLIYALLDMMLLARIQPNNPILVGILIFLIVILLSPLQKWVESTFDANRRSNLFDHEALAVEYTAAFSATTSKQNAIAMLSEVVREIASPDKSQIFIYDQEVGGYSQPHFLNVERTEKTIIPASAPLPSTLKILSSSLFIRGDAAQNEGMHFQSILKQEDVSYLHIPITGNYGLLGWISIANKNKQRPYTSNDIKLLESLAAQFALVYERSDTIESLNSHLKEMEIINHIAVAINNQTDFDELLLSIFQSTQELFKIDQISLVLKQKRSETYLRHFLFKEGTIKISTEKPQRLESGFPEEIAIQKNEAVLSNVDDETWLFIPLTTKSEAIGVLSLGSKKETASFDQTLLSLSDSISSLTTGAIIKTRLLASSRAQLQHLERLNEVSKELSSTLAVAPLLEKIVENAKEILNSSSSALLIVDKSDDTLVFSVVSGPVAASLNGTRIPKFAGVAGETYRTQQPMIYNNIQEDELHYWNDDPHINQQIQNLIAVPLIAHDEVIGILEVLNKEEGLGYDAADKAALEGFASQAAIALHNANLYSKTDSALEKRVSELYTMQQIDKKLHSSQELKQALQTTLTAALTYTRNESGTIMLLDTYYREVDDIWQKSANSDKFNHLEKFDLSAFPWFMENIEGPYQLVEEDANAISKQLALRPNHQAHMLIPTKLDDDLYSLIILHLGTPEDINSQDVDFLLSLNNHAAIALRNAILYEDLQEAVNAKNEFISFISHELKNPLTAIKGHADVLAKGMVGEINKEQEDFLKTISHNVRRMNTFITDLSDQSQIETKSLRLDFAPADVHDLINEVLQTYGQQIRAKSITVDTNIQIDVPDVFCDRLRLIQVLSNLVSNAVKYTQEGGKIIVTAEHAINEWDLKGAAEVVHFSVKDNGFGINYEDQNHLFTKFFRGTNENILKISGTGLGLRISKSLTEMMGGTMWFESTPGKGSTFHFTIPI
ncbi:MAG: GAF domain-containing protein [Chloroflexota bacterium]|nr:GAF domain-containing protein [Chloroflexota bacterium]